MGDDPRTRSTPDGEAEGPDVSHARRADSAGVDGTDPTSTETDRARAGADDAGPGAIGADAAEGHAADPQVEVVDPLATVPPAPDPLWTLLTSEVTDPVPDGVRGAARSSLGWRDPDSALAALIADSAADEGRLAYVRGATGSGQPRLLTFAAAQLTIEVEVTAVRSPGGTATISLVGQLIPPGPGAVAVDHSAGTVDVPPDAVGRFQATGLGPGPLRLRYGAETAVAVRTDWFLP